MVDWIWNLATEYQISELTIDIFNKSVVPSSLQSDALIVHLTTLKETIFKTLKQEGFQSDFIQQACFLIKINQPLNQLTCKAKLEDKNGNVYLGQEYLEHPYQNDFRQFKTKDKNDFEWTMESDNSLNSAEWFGAIIRYWLNSRDKEFKYYYNQRQLRKNLIIGWLLQVFVAILLFSFIIYFSLN